MRRRILLFHIGTLVAALVALLAVSGGVLHLVGSIYQRQGVPAADGRSDRAQAVLAQWPEDGRDWEALDAALGELDYQMAVQLDGRVVYNSLNPFQFQLYQAVADGASWPADGTLSVQNDGAVMIGRQVGRYTVVTMSAPVGPTVLGEPRPRSEFTVISLLASGVAAIGIIVLLSVFITKYQVRRMLQPVQALIDGAQRVEGGDLSTPVAYQGEDEFTAVCAAFDHMQEHLRQEREKNAQYERSRTDLVAGISHDLRTPLTSVKGYLKGMRDGVANTPEKREQYLDVAYRKACDMERLLQRLFYFSRLETGSLPLFRTREDLGEFVRRFARDAREELAPLGGQVILRGAPASHPVLIDSEQMYRVLSNLKDNALRYAGADPLVLTLTVWRQRDRECVRFADNGAGVTEEQLPHLFEQFWRGDQARSSQGGEGSGLGLYIVRHIVEAHGGTVRAQNDHGLVFEIALPCEEGEPHEQ